MFSILGIEDHAVFPVLATRMDVSKLQQDHAEMDTIIANIEQASCAGLENLESISSDSAHHHTLVRTDLARAIDNL